MAFSKLIGKVGQPVAPLANALLANRLVRRGIEAALRIHRQAPLRQYRAHRLGRPAVDVLALVPQLRIIESRADCCGTAGTYGYKTEKYQIAIDVGNPLFDFVRRMDSPVVVCDSETCRWQITHATRIPAVHPVELLAAAYGYEPEGPLAEII
jgi:glycerol-3-phosphate dehydrogenase subunit C